jgi:hypothetical protein
MTLLLVVGGICAALLLALVSIRNAARREREKALAGLRRVGLL